MQVPGSTFLLRDPPSMKRSDQSVIPSMLALLKCMAIGTWKSLRSRIVFTYYELRLVVVGRAQVLVWAELVTLV